MRPAASRALLLGTLALFASCVALGIHGYSLPIWHGVLDGSPAEEVLLGEAQPIRSDDWLVTLPLALAQRAHDPPFPRVNRNIGAGQDLILMDLPIAHFATLFRPVTWGFFLGRDAGIAWMWWSQLLGLFAAWLLVLRSVAQGRSGLAALGAALLVLSPFMQFWAFAPARLAAYAGAAIAGTLGLLGATSRRGILAGALLSGWAVGCWGLSLYPPFQLPLVPLALLLVGTLGWPTWRASETRRGWRVAGLALAAAIAALAAGGFWWSASDAIDRMLRTAYPGARAAAAGGLPVWQIFGHDLWIGAWVERWRPLGNISEAASFWLLFPALGPAVLREWIKGRGDGPSLALLATAVVCFLYAWAGRPAWLAGAPLLGSVPPERVLLALGLADLLLLVRFLSRSAPTPQRGDRRFALGVAVAFAAGLALCVGPLCRALPTLRAGPLWAAAALNGALAYAVLRRRRPALLLAAMLGVTAACTLWFNPLVRGGSDFLLANPLSREIAAIDRAAGGKSVWLAYGPSYQPNLFRVLGVRAINGVHPLPQLELWRRLDPRGEQERIYNRYAHVVARSGPDQRARFRLTAPDAFELIAQPGSEAVRSLGVTHVLVVTHDPAGPDGLPGIERIASYGANHLYRLLPADAPPRSPDEP